jgi:hypothetical protein
MKEKLRQVRSAMCVNRREIAHTRLEAMAGADNPFSLIAIFRRGHWAIKAGGAVHVTRCAPVKVTPRSHRNCTEEIPAILNVTEIFVDPHQLCNNISWVSRALQRYRPSRVQVGREMVLQLS